MKDLFTKQDIQAILTSYGDSIIAAIQANKGNINILDTINQYITDNKNTIDSDKTYTDIPVFTDQVIQIRYNLIESINIVEERSESAINRLLVHNLDMKFKDLLRKDVSVLQYSTAEENPRETTEYYYQDYLIRIDNFTAKLYQRIL